MVGAWSTLAVPGKGLILLLLQHVPLPPQKQFIFVVCKAVPPPQKPFMVLPPLC